MGMYRRGTISFAPHDISELGPIFGGLAVLIGGCLARFCVGPYGGISSRGLVNSGFCPARYIPRQTLRRARGSFYDRAAGSSGCVKTGHACLRYAIRFNNGILKLKAVYKSPFKLPFQLT
jgi:hypothetical protein